MSKHLWKVEFEIKFTGYGEWMEDQVFHVVANGDGMKAVVKAKRLAMKSKFDEIDAGKPTGFVHEAVKCRLVGLEQLQLIQA